MARPTRDALIGELQRRLVLLDVSDDVRRTVTELIREDLARGGRADAGVGIGVARTFNRMALRATTELGSSSLSMLVMLFDLFAAHEQGRTISVSSLCIASGAASTTALRQIGHLEARGFVTRRGDERDRRRWWVCPTARAMDLVRSLVDDWATMA